MQAKLGFEENQEKFRRIRVTSASYNQAPPVCQFWVQEPLILNYSSTCDSNYG